VNLSHKDSIFYSIRATANNSPFELRVDDFQSSANDDCLIPAADDETVTIIIPIYRDFDATRSCLTSLKSALAGKSNCLVILVDDASPEAKIKTYLKRFVDLPNFILVTNTANRGFVGAVNRVLGGVSAGDVILLNSDTVVPHGFADRLRATASS